MEDLRGLKLRNGFGSLGDEEEMRMRVSFYRSAFEK